MTCRTRINSLGCVQFMTIVLVHGTGIRRPRFDLALHTFTSAVARHLPGHEVSGCYWGDIGAASNFSGLSRIPPSDPHATLAQTTRQASLWEALADDPLIELKVLNSTDHFAPYTPNLEEDLIGLLIPPRGDLALLLARLNATEDYEAAVESLVRDPSFRDVRHHFVEPWRESLVLARAIVAQSLLQVDTGADQPPLTARDLTLVTNLIVKALGGQPKGVKTDAILRTAVRLGLSSPLDKNQRRLVDWAAMTVGDIALYLARGADIRSRVVESIGAAAKPRVVVGHSLGGVAAFECAVEGAPIDHLITVGSQAPFLYELNALPRLPVSEDLPDLFPTWDNVYDGRDALAFVGSGLWNGRVQDHRVDSGLPFPRCHSGYFVNDAFYFLLRRLLT
jgi:hypothetical protein